MHTSTRTQVWNRTAMGRRRGGWTVEFDTSSTNNPPPLFQMCSKRLTKSPPPDSVDVCIDFFGLPPSPLFSFPSLPAALFTFRFQNAFAFSFSSFPKYLLPSLLASLHAWGRKTRLHTHSSKFGKNTPRLFAATIFAIKVQVFVSAIF